MKVSKYLLSAVLSCTLLAGVAQAQTSTDTATTPGASTSISQDSPTYKSNNNSPDTPVNNSTTSSTNTSTQPMAPAQAPAQPQTRVEIHNDTPVSAPQSTTPNINIKMPDVNVASPATNTTTKETVTQHDSSVVVHDNNDAEASRANSTWMIVLFGVLAVLLIGAIFMGISRRTTVIDEI